MRIRKNFLCLNSFFAIACLLQAVAFAEEAEYKRSPYYKAIAIQYRLLDESEGDLNGDGLGERVISYRQTEDAFGVSGGIMILSPKGGSMGLAWHAFFKGFFPRRATVSGKTLRIDFSEITQNGENNFERVLEYGKHIFFRNEKGNPFYGTKITASSSKKGVAPPENAFDGDLHSAWAEGAEGTGVGETLTFEFSHPVDLGLIGVLPGNVNSKKDWLENNRLHRADVTVETYADRFDVGTDVDLDRDLGLGLYGDIVEMEFSNQPVLKYFVLDKKRVVSLELKIRSVLLGEKNDDTYVAEVDFAEMFDRESLEKLIRGERETISMPQAEKKQEASSKPEESEGEDEEEGF